MVADNLELSYLLIVLFCMCYFGEFTKLWLIIMKLNVSATSEDQGKAKL